MYDPAYDSGGSVVVEWLIILGIYFFLSFAQYKIAQKVGCADKAWWAFIPIASLFLLIKTADKEIWWFVLCLIPVVNIVCFAIMWMETAKATGHSPTWGLLVLVPFVNFVAVGVMAFTMYDTDDTGPIPDRVEKREPTHVG